MTKRQSEDSTRAEKKGSKSIAYGKPEDYSDESLKEFAVGLVKAMRKAHNARLEKQKDSRGEDSTESKKHS